MSSEEKLMPECVACEDKPAAGNDPCALCGATRHPTPAADEVEAREIADPRVAALVDAAKAIVENDQQAMDILRKADVPIDPRNFRLSEALHTAIAALQARSAEPAGEEPGCISDIIQDVAELPDRDSPEDWPEAMLVTGEELRIILERYLPATPTNPERLVEALNRIIEIDQHQLLMDEPQDGSCAAIARAALSAAPLKEGE